MIFYEKNRYKHLGIRNRGETSKAKNSEHKENHTFEAILRLFASVPSLGLSHQVYKTLRRVRFDNK